MVEQQRQIEMDFNKLKVALVPNMTSIDREEVVELQQHAEVEAFEAWCEKMVDRSYRRLVVRFSILTVFKMLLHFFLCFRSVS